MNEKIKNYLGFAGASALTVLTLLLIVGIYATYTLSRSVDPAENRSFSVSAEGEINTIPDVAQFSFSVITEGGTDVEKLQSENSEKINGIIALIKEQGVEDKDIQTTNYSVTPRYLSYRCNIRDAKPCPPSEIVGYTVRASVAVDARDFEALGAMLAGVAKKGANTISGPNFTIDDPDEARAKAREQAIEKAHKKAKEMAKAGNFRLGKLLSIQEGSEYYSYAMRVESMAFDGVSEKMEAPMIEPGSQDVTVNITLRYEIK